MTPSQAYRTTQLAEPPKIYTGIDSLLHRWSRFIPRRRRTLRDLEKSARRVHESVEEVGDWALDKLRRDLRAHRDHVRAHPDEVAEISEDALASVAEAVRRRLRLYPHPEQILASLAMLRGDLVEVATGEGKTVAIAMVAVLRAWTGRPCHVVTANDYLAERDAKYLQPFFELCGVTRGFVVGEMSPDERRSQYCGDVVYTTAKELAADYLRDDLGEEPFDHPGRRLVRQMYSGRAASERNRVLRGLHTVVVDEADNGLIDEAVTPLIISQPKENKALESATLKAYELAKSLEKDIHYRREEQTRSIKILEKGYETIAAATAPLSGIWQGKTRRVELILRALEAREYFHRDKQYVVEDGEIVIVDEATGRRMPGRSWRQGLHQAVEAKEEVDITAPAVTVASISFQRFFRQFHTICGATGTAYEASNEFWRIYGLRVSRIPLHRPCRRVEKAPRILATKDEKWKAVIAECSFRHDQGQPILVGTRNVFDSEELADLLGKEGLSCRVLNAVRHRDEAAVISGAGHAGRITIATNMAGRGTDIQLEEGVQELGGLCVIATELHDSGRVDRQLYGRSGRQGDPGIALTFASFDDDLPEKFLKGWTVRFCKKCLESGLLGSTAAARFVLKHCQKRSEKQSFRRREAVLKADEQREKSLGFTAK